MNSLQTNAYGMTTTVVEPFEEAISKVKAIFKEHGFGALSEIDVRAALLEKTGETIEPYTILGMCNPRLASRAIAAEHEIGLLLPCNVLVHERGGAVHVSAQDPVALLALAQNEALATVAEEAKRGIEAAMQDVASS